MTLIIIKDEFNWVATTEKIVNTALVSVLVFRRPVFSRASSRPHTRANEGKCALTPAKPLFRISHTSGEEAHAHNEN